MAAMSAKPTFRIIFAIVALYCAYLFLKSFQGIQSSGKFEAVAVRLRVLGLRNGTVFPEVGPLPPPSMVNVASFGLLLNGCLTTLAAADKLSRAGHSAWNKTAELYLDQPMNFNGYYFETVAGRPPADDPTMWALEALTNESDVWTTVGASVWRVNRRTGIVELFPNLDCDIRSSPGTGTTGLIQLGRPGQGQFVTKDMRFQQTFQFIPFIWAIYAVAGSGVSVAAASRGFISASILWSACFMFIGILAIVAALMNSLQPSLWRDIPGYFAQAVVHLLFAVSVQWAEQHFFLFFGLFAASNLLINLVEDVQQYEFRWVQAVKEEFPSVAYVGMAITCLVIMSRQLAFVQARKMVLADWQSYESAWKELLTCAKADILDVRELCRGLIKKGHNYRVLRQLQSYQDFYVPQSTSLNSLLWTLFLKNSKIASVDSLDQLFVQAHCLHPFLLAKTKAWAAASEGCFPSSSTAGRSRYLRYEDGAAVKMAKVKSVTRAIEKLVRSYSQVFTKQTIFQYFV